MGTADQSALRTEAALKLEHEIFFHEEIKGDVSQ